MSAFIVNDYHINALTSWAVYNDVSFYWKAQRYEFNKSTADFLAGILYSENVRSVNHRYNERTRRQGFNFQRVLIDDLEPADIICACDCLRYQSCETSNYDRTLARAATVAIRDAAVHALIDGHSCWELRPPEGNRNLVQAASDLGILEVVHVR